MIQVIFCQNDHQVDDREMIDWLVIFFYLAARARKSTQVIWKQLSCVFIECQMNEMYKMNEITTKC